MVRVKLHLCEIEWGKCQCEENALGVFSNVTLSFVAVVFLWGGKLKLNGSFPWIGHGHLSSFPKPLPLVFADRFKAGFKIWLYSISGFPIA